MTRSQMWRLGLKRAFFCGACLLLHAAFPAQGKSLSGEECLNEISALQEQNAQRLQEVDQRLKSIIEKSMESSSSQTTEKDIASLQQKRKEYMLRQRFFDRLQFYVDTYYKGGSWRTFFQQSLKQMTEIEVKSLNSSDKLWRFMNSLAIVLQHAPDDHSNLVSFIEGYINESSIMNPASPESYQNKLDYTNGREGYQARGVSREEVGEVVEERKQKLKTITIKAPLLRSATISN